MPETMPDFKSQSHAQLVLICEGFWQEMQGLRKRIENLELENQAFKANGAKIKKTSRNSSLPPSKDQKKNVVEATEVKERQYSHHQGGRELNPNPDYRVHLEPNTCVHCGKNLVEVTKVIQAVYDKIELPKIQPITTQVTLSHCQCPNCQTINRPIIPDGLENNGVFGKSVKTLVTHARFSQAIGLHRLSLFCKEVLNLEISQGGIVNILKSVAEAIKPSLIQITDAVQRGEVIKSDETSTRVKGKTYWEWVFACQEACLHILRDSRSQAAIGVVFPKEILAKYHPRVWVSDLYRGQGHHVADEWQVCLSHQLRDCDYAITMGDTIFAVAIKALFAAAIRLHHRRHELAASTWVVYRSRVKQALKANLLLKPTTKEGLNLLRRYLEVQDSLLTFLKYPDVPPTNNESEQRIRWSVIFRKVTNGSRSVWAAELFMAYRSVVNTGAKHGLSALESLNRALSPTPFLPIVALNSS